jgi:hypothetical protein
MPRWLSVAVVASVFLLVLVAARLVFVLRTDPRLTRENFGRIHGGMSRREVEALMGPPGDYRTGPTTPSEVAGHIGDPSRPEVRLVWKGDEAEFSVWVRPDPSERVWGISFIKTGPLQVGMVDWLKWRWQRLCGNPDP